MMDQAWVITTLLGLVAVLFAIIVLMVGWMGNKLYNRLGEMGTHMRGLESNLYGEIRKLDRRVTRVEPKRNLTQAHQA